MPRSKQGAPSPVTPDAAAGPGGGSACGPLQRPDLYTRVILIVLDGAGCGALPDAAAYGDEHSDTLGHVAAQRRLRIPHLRQLGLGRLVALDPGTETTPGGGFQNGTRSEATRDRTPGVISQDGTRHRVSVGRMAEVSPGKDSVTGHWEMTGLRLVAPFATFPQGFPATLIADFERQIGRRTLGNVVASGTEIIDRLGPEHLSSGRPIVYTSADSVFQVAAHEEVIPLAEQYRICRTAFDLVRPLGVARVIARPFVGAPGAFTRTANRHDYAVPPAGETLLDRLTAADIPVVAIGKIHDLFAGRGITRSVATGSDAEGMQRVREEMDAQDRGLIFANLVDFDTVYGHRNDVAGYAANLERFDADLGGVLQALRADDLLVITADHGNDPTTPGTDHSREYVPILIAGAATMGGGDLGTRETFADLGQTIAANFSVGPLAHGASFLEALVGQHS